MDPMMGPRMRLVMPVDELVELATLTMGDAPVLARLVRDNVTRLSPWLPFATPAYDEPAARGYIQQCAADWASGRGTALGIWVNGTLSGSIGVHAINWVEGHGSIGYWIASEGEGRGLVTRSAARLLYWMFDEVGLERAEIRAAIDNRKSRQVAERLGFQMEGVARHGAEVAGRWLDMAVYGLLRSEWRVRIANT